MPIRHFNEMDHESFIQQAKDFKMLDYNAMNKAIKLIAIADESHPWTVMRAAELLKWISGDEIRGILAPYTQKYIK